MPRRPPSPPIPLDPGSAEAVVGAAIDWFARHGRDLPWRRTRDPWRILVSEVMLQQLRVARTLPFYERVIARFPSPASLASVPLGDLLIVWGDLGRYRAAAALYKAAGIIVAEHDGRVPTDVATLTSLPGVGPYTAGAVACFATEADVAFLDTNARRVLHRVFVGVDVPSPTVAPSALQDLAHRLVPAGRSWAWNQALIEVGALLCTARTARCHACPLAAWCAARPAIQGALSDSPRTVRPARYAGTNRQHRGQVLRAIREADDLPVSLDALGPRVKPDFSLDDRPWITAVIDSLAADGLILRHPPPAAPARVLAEEQAPYVVEEPPTEPIEIWLSLP